MKKHICLNKNTEEVYSYIRSIVITAQNKVYSAVNSTMVMAYWKIGKKIYLACGESDRAGYGQQLLKYIAEKLS